LLGIGGMGAGGGKERRGDAAAGGQGDCGGGATSEGIAVSSDPFLFPVFFLRVRAAVVATRRGEERSGSGGACRRGDGGCVTPAARGGFAWVGIRAGCCCVHGFDPNPTHAAPVQDSRFRRSPPGMTCSFLFF
jgi:hypothetical protein